MSPQQFSHFIPSLMQAALFKGLSEQNLQALLERCVQREHKAGEEILHEGENGNSMLVIASGTVEYIKSGRPVGEGSTGDFFGEIALLSKTPIKRQASVKAKTDCVLLEIFPPDFRDTLQGCPECSLAIIDVLVQRIQAASPPEGVKSKVNLAFLALLIPGLTGLLVQVMPEEMAGETAKMIVEQLEMYLVPLIAAGGLAARRGEVQSVLAGLSGK